MQGSDVHFGQSGVEKARRGCREPTAEAAAAAREVQWPGPETVVEDKQMEKSKIKSAGDGLSRHEGEGGLRMAPSLCAQGWRSIHGGRDAGRGHSLREESVTPTCMCWVWVAPWLCGFGGQRRSCACTLGIVHMNGLLGVNPPAQHPGPE